MLDAPVVEEVARRARPGGAPMGGTPGADPVGDEEQMGAMCRRSRQALAAANGRGLMGRRRWSAAFLQPLVGHALLLAGHARALLACTEPRAKRAD